MLNLTITQFLQKSFCGTAAYLLVHPFIFLKPHVWTKTYHQRAAFLALPFYYSPSYSPGITIHPVFSEVPLMLSH